ncbi:polysaccharide deacetylase family protein [Hyphomicrobium sp. CS1GBMeth3]|uniref:polysaccharide deacetylase family protein n=1 Tax=Hyphomicrobium sp. CS1GBMeth3 TaxID=1892845 RepID=UPI0009F837F2|nr:polysaccharide deacetylase family protein [Hyphomicrobium sp. CS1GBMeth3]
MRASRCTWLALAFVATMAAALAPAETLAETGFGFPAEAAANLRDSQEQEVSVGPVRTHPGTGVSGCEGRSDVLGVSRVVEIDTTSGPEFGDQYSKTEPKFLEPGEIVLTFDDGPARRYTMPILEALDEQCVKATFFSVGRMAISDPATLQEVARRGHTVGTHTWSHKNLSALGAAAMKREFELGLSAVSAALGSPAAPFFRFPYLGHNNASRNYIRSRGIGVFGIHVDSTDFRTKNPAVVRNNILTRLGREKKGILLFHDIQPSTAGALATLLEELKERGYKVVHMVSKHPAVTLPEYDAIAEKSLRAKSVAAAKSPLAERSATWPVSGPEPDEVQTPAKPSAPSARPANRPAKPQDWSNPSNDPWQLRSFGWE